MRIISVVFFLLAVSTQLNGQQEKMMIVDFNYKSKVVDNALVDSIVIKEYLLPSAGYFETEFQDKETRITFYPNMLIKTYTHFNYNSEEQYAAISSEEGCSIIRTFCELTEDEKSYKSISTESHLNSGRIITKLGNIYKRVERNKEVWLFCLVNNMLPQCDTVQYEWLPNMIVRRFNTSADVIFSTTTDSLLFNTQGEMYHYINCSYINKAILICKTEAWYKYNDIGLVESEWGKGTFSDESVKKIDVRNYSYTKIDSKGNWTEKLVKINKDKIPLRKYIRQIYYRKE